MSDLAVIAADPSTIERAADPAEFMVLACERAKSWLTQALEVGDIDTIVELKSQAEAIRVYTAQKQLGKDTELAAAEIVRRAERGIGVAIRKGQEEGTITRTGSKRSSHDPLPAPSDIVPKWELSGQNGGEGIYAMTDGVSDDEFEEAIAEAKDEENLARANVIRKVKKKPSQTTANVATAKRMAAEGYTSRQIGEAIGVNHMGTFTRRHGIEVPADAGTSKTRRVDSTRIVNELAHTLDGLAMAVDLADPGQVDPAVRADLAESIGLALRSLNRFHKRMKELT